MPNPGDFTPTNLEYVAHFDQDETALASGGDVQVCISATQDLHVGEVVYFSATGALVDKSTTIANYQTFAGVVVGGRQTGGRAVSKASDIGVLAAHSGELVLVQTSGTANVIAGAAITAPAKVSGDSGTAGRVLGGAGAVAGQIVGIVLQTAAGAASVVLMQIIHM